MPKLNIAHHKSYHPYRRDNIERVRRDEEEARRKEEHEEGRMMLADSEARLDLLRERSGSKHVSKKKAARLKDEADEKLIRNGRNPLIVRDSEESEQGPEPHLGSALPQISFTSPTGHINLFASQEASLSNQAAHLAEKKAREAKEDKEREKGVELAPSMADRTPWYADNELRSAQEREGDERSKERKRQKIAASKKSSDPLMTMNAHLKKRAEVLSSSSSSHTFRAPALPGSTAASRHIVASLPSSSRTSQPSLQPSSSSGNGPDLSDARTARLTRESSERARALELIARKKRETMSDYSATPMSDSGSRYSDLFNKQETREAGERRRGAHDYHVRGHDRRDVRWDDDEGDGRRISQRSSSRREW